MNKLLKVLIICFLPIALSMGVSAASPNRHLERIVSLINTSPSVNIEFSIDANGNTGNGLVTMAGNKFHVKDNQGNYETWFDGKTQWTWSGMTNEVSIIEPSGDELIEINPFYIVNTATANYDITSVNGAGGRTVLNFAPKSKNNSIEKVIIIISESTGYPEKMQIYESGNRNPVTVEFRKISAGGKTDDKFFRFDVATHPGMEINDLR